MRQICLLFVLAITTMIASCASNAEKQKEVVRYVPKNLEDFQKKKQAVYIEIATAVGQLLAHPERDSVFVKNFESYKTLYYGEALMFEDTVVNHAMKQFKETTGDYYDGEINTKELRLKEVGMNLVLKLKNQFNIAENH